MNDLPRRGEGERLVDERDLSPLLPRESPHHGFRGEDSARLRPAVPTGLTIAISREAPRPLRKATRLSPTAPRDSALKDRLGNYCLGYGFQMVNAG